MSIPGRNDPCPCGSGKKYKNCCGNLAAAPQRHVWSMESGDHALKESNAVSISKLLQEAVGLHQAGMLNEAIVLYRRVIPSCPDPAMVYNNMGLALQTQGKLNEAIASYRQALSLKPDFVGAYGNLGNAFQGLGRLSEAVDCYQKAISLKPDLADAHYNLGIVLSAQGKLDAAVESYGRALLYQPDNVAAYINMGNALQEQNKLREATECYRKVITLKPEFVEAYNNLGKVLKEQGELEEAISCHLKAISLNPSHADSHVDLALAYFDMGRFDNAQAILSDVLDIHPEHPGAWPILAGLRKMTPADSGWLDTALRLASDPELSEMKKVSLWFAIGKYYDDTKQYDLAFPAYQRANALADSQWCQKGMRFDRAELTRYFDDLAAAWPADPMKRLHGGSRQSRLPVLIVGMPRSGTTLTEQIIASHPEAFGAGELRFWGEQFKANRKPLLSATHEATLIATLASEYEQCLRRYSSEATRIVDKMPHNFTLIGLIHEVFPQARFIHTRRNPVDTCLSIYFHYLNSSHAYATSLENLAFYYREYERLMKHWRSVLPSDRFLEVSYEDLTDNQSEGSRRIIEFIGLEWDERCLDFHKTERRVGTYSNWQVRQKIYHSSKARWRHYEKHLGPLLGLLDEV